MEQCRTWPEVWAYIEHDATFSRQFRTKTVDRPLQLPRTASLGEHVAHMRRHNGSYSVAIEKWTFELESDTRRDRLKDIDHGTVDPSANVDVMLHRVRVAHAFIKDNFARNSGVYIGKTTNFMPRFNAHKPKALGSRSILMLALGSFDTRDIPRLLRDCWKMDGEAVALLYEKLLFAAVRTSGLPRYAANSTSMDGSLSQKEGGGDVGIVYGLWVVEKPKKVPVVVDAEANRDRDQDLEDILGWMV